MGSTEDGDETEGGVVVVESSKCWWWAVGESVPCWWWRLWWRSDGPASGESAVVALLLLVQVIT